MVELTYHTRYYRQSPDSQLPLEMLAAVRSELEGLLLLGFAGDHGSFAITVGTPPWDDDLKVLRHNWAFDALVNAIPASGAWVAPENATPLNDVETMAGHSDVRRHYLIDGEPVVTGLLAVGDSMCTTNPAFGWGASMALTYAFAAVDALTQHEDPVDAACAYDSAVCREADEVFREASAMDRPDREQLLAILDAAAPT